MTYSDLIITCKFTAIQKTSLVCRLGHSILHWLFSNIPELDGLNIDTTCFKKTVNCSALVILGFLAETSSWFQSGPLFLKI